jgi:hypothetical protein
MVKKCIFCDEEAKYCIKGTSDYYCDECAREHFSDLNLLVRVEEIANLLKAKLDKIKLDKDGQVIHDDEHEDVDLELNQ